jgi:hypothetical protein
VLRLVGTILAEQDDEWQDGRRYFRPETMGAIDAVTTTEEASQPLLLASEGIRREDDVLLHHASWDLTGAKAAGVSFSPPQSRRRAPHDVYLVGGQRVPIPRHREINEYTARSILDDLEEVLGENWWNDDLRR